MSRPDLAKAAAILAAEVSRLHDELLIRDMQVSTLKELLSDAEAKCDQLRARWDRAETALERSCAETDPLHPTGRHPDGGCGCVDMADPGCVYHSDEADRTVGREGGGR